MAWAGQCRGWVRSRFVVALLNHADLWLLPMVIVVGWFYFPYCQTGPNLCIWRALLHRNCPGCGLDARHLLSCAWARASSARVQPYVAVRPFSDDREFCEGCAEHFPIIGIEYGFQSSSSVVHMTTVRDRHNTMPRQIRRLRKLSWSFRKI